MNSIVAPIVVGVIVIAIGIMNMMGNISTLHWYHRRNVSEEDRVPFGRKIGLGTIIVGASVILKACLQYAAEKGGNQTMVTIGTVVLAVGLVIGFAIIIYALMKYNKGIF